MKVMQRFGLVSGVALALSSCALKVQDSSEGNNYNNYHFVITVLGSNEDDLIKISLDGDCRFIGYVGHDLSTNFGMRWNYVTTADYAEVIIYVDDKQLVDKKVCYENGRYLYLIFSRDGVVFSQRRDELLLD